MLINRARALRKRQTPAEAKLWSLLRNRQLLSFKFRRQHPVSGYIVDFICLQKFLIIEADGATHSTEQELLYDQTRTLRLNKQGFKILRFYNANIFNNPESVLETIITTLDNL